MSKKKKCQFEGCKRKLGLLDDIACKCGLSFCTHHRFSGDHACTYDYRAEHMERLRRENPKVVKDKIDKI